MNRFEKIQLLKDIQAGKRSITETLPDKVIPIRVTPDGMVYQGDVIAKEALDILIADFKKTFNVIIVWVRRGLRSNIKPAGISW